jgi:hypothetical protein
MLWVAEGKGTAERIALGRDLYVANCASCHGIDLEGQSNWRSPGPDGRLPAPPHDEIGHTGIIRMNSFWRSFVVARWLSSVATTKATCRVLPRF